MNDTGKRGRPNGRFVQVSRLGRLREKLESNPAGLTLFELSALLEMSERSVRRYLDQLSFSTELESVPTSPGGAHVWRFKPSEHARSLTLRRSQAYALLAARKVFEPLRGSALFDELEVTWAALEKLAKRPGRTATKGELSAEANLEGRFFALPTTTTRYVNRGEELDSLFFAVAERRRIEATDRLDPSRPRLVLEPYAMVLEGDGVVVVGRQPSTGARGAWPFHRLHGLSVRNDHFELPTSLDPSHDASGTLGFAIVGEPVDVIVELTERAWEELRHQRFHPAQRVAHARASKLVRLLFPATDLARVERWVLGLGPEARVIAPESLAEAVARSARKIYELYT